jgi:hypothetical protein
VRLDEGLELEVTDPKTKLGEEAAKDSKGKVELRKLQGEDGGKTRE